jgi:transposase InsO family protein
MVNAHFNLKISRFRSDNGRKYITNALMEHFEKQDIQMECTVSYTPEQNGVAERLNGTTVEKARCMLLSSNLSKSFWTEAVTTAAFLINRSPTAALENCTPAEKWFGSKPNLKKVRIFGCLVYQHIPNQLNSRKFDTWTRKCILLGYAPNGYRLWLLEERKILVGHDVIFDEVTW